MIVRLREASPADLPGIVEVFLSCWRDSYSSVLPQSVITGMTNDRAEALWTAALDGSRGERVMLVADDAVGPLGVVRFRSARETGAVESLYVSPSAQRGGLGARLLAAATAAMYEQGARVGALWVFAANRSALAFYRRHGWSPDGATRTQPEFGEPEVRLAHRLVAAPGAATVGQR
jgi:GNAT superfamily N-acetyltransferase